MPLIIEKEQQLLPQFDPEVSKLIQKELEAQGVQFNLGEQVRSFPGRTFVEQVQTNRGTYPCDLCVVAIGVTPNTGLLAGTGAQLAPNGAVLIGADLATSVPNIYAVGIPANLAQLNKVDPADFAALAELALHDTCMSTNQITPTRGEVVAVYTAAFRG